MSAEQLRAELEALRERRAARAAETKATAEEAELRAAIASAKREEENDDIKARFAPKKNRRFFDFDPDGEQPHTVDHKGHECALYTRFVVKGANADQLERHGEAIVVRGVDTNGKPDVTIDMAKQLEVTNECAVTCVVYPTAETAGVSPEQHAKNIAASLWYLGAARAEVGRAAIELGGVDAAARRAKS